MGRFLHLTGLNSSTSGNQHLCPSDVNMMREKQINIQFLPSRLSFNWFLEELFIFWFWCHRSDRVHRHQSMGSINIILSSVTGRIQSCFRTRMTDKNADFMTINIKAIVTRTLMFSFYFNLKMNVLANVW